MAAGASGVAFALDDVETYSKHHSQTDVKLRELKSIIIKYLPSDTHHNNRLTATLDDMKEGIIASRIAAHAADISKKVPNAIDWDNRMAKYRADIDWEGMFTEAIDEEKARRYRKESTPENEDTCTMCGKMCSMRTMKKVMSGEDVNILK